jgi:hypothetical protein
MDISYTNGTAHLYVIQMFVNRGQHWKGKQNNF